MEYVAEFFYRRSAERAEANEVDSYLEFFQHVRPSWGPVVTLYREVSGLPGGGDVIAVRLSFDAASYLDAAGRLEAVGLPEHLVPHGIRVVPESLMAAIA